MSSLSRRAGREAVLRAGASGVFAAMLLALPGTASAAAGTPGIQVYPSYGPPGTVVRVTGTGFCVAGCGPVTIYVGTEQVALDVAVSRSGGFTRNVEIPGSVRPGTVPVSARQQDATGAVRQASGSFSVVMGVPPPTRLPLPTGSPPVQPVPGVSSTPTSTSTSSGSTAATRTQPPSAVAASAVPSPLESSAATVATTDTSPGRLSPLWWLAAIAIAAALAAALAVVRRRRGHPPG